MTLILLLSFVAFLVSAACGFVSIPVILNFCKKKRLYDLPNERKVHKVAVPRLGGVSFFPSMFIATFFALIVWVWTSHTFTFQVNAWGLAFAIGLTLIYFVGLVDDLVGLGAVSKFAVQIVAASLLPLCGHYINNLYGFCGIYTIPFVIGAPLTVFVLVLLMNAMNLIDGIDGLSGTLSLLALGGFWVCFMQMGVLVYSMLIAGLMGVLVPYLYFNLLGDPQKNRKIFMGDSGSLTLGFILGVLLVKLAMGDPHVNPPITGSLGLALTFVLVPVLDVARVILVRIRHRQPLFKADKNHIHHKLLRAGFTQHQALLIIDTLAIGFIVVNVVLFHFDCSVTLVAIIDVALYFFFHECVDRLIRRQGNNIFSAEGVAAEADKE